MPDPEPHPHALGPAIRERRKAMHITATATAEAAGVSRVTLHRIEKGEPGVALGAYANVVAALGLELGIVPRKAEVPQARAGWIPARVALADYPQLRQLAWQVHGVDALTPAEAWSIYERNWRHVDEATLSDEERALVAGLRLAFNTAGGDVPA